MGMGSFFSWWESYTFSYW